MVPSVPPVPLPKDAVLVELRPDALTFETREAVLPGTPVAFLLVMEGQPLTLVARCEVCMVVGRDRTGYMFECRIPFADVTAPDRGLIALFISKGRGAPGLVSPLVSS
jgi:hypothetical protein